MGIFDNADDHSKTFIQMFYVALSSSIIATLLSAWLIRQHIKNFNSPPIQSKIIGILWMIPIYSFNSTMSLLFPGLAIYIDMARDCYEAYVLYLFFSLLLSFLCGGDETYMIEYLETLPPSKHPFPFNLCIGTYLPTGNDYLRYAKFGTLQYCIVRPCMAILAFLLTFIGWYEEGNFNPLTGAYFYISMALNISIAFAFSSLLSFYYTFKYDLRPLEPVPKFLLIKSIIFCIFWQGLLLALLVDAHIIPVPSGTEYTNKTYTATLQDFLICLEMTLAAIVNIYAFDYQPFVDDYLRIIGPYHNSNNLKSIPTVAAAYRNMKITTSNSSPLKQKRYTSNIRRGKERKARTESNDSNNELTESLLENYDEEAPKVEKDDEEEIILNNYENKSKIKSNKKNQQVSNINSIENQSTFLLSSSEIQAPKKKKKNTISNTNTNNTEDNQNHEKVNKEKQRNDNSITSSLDKNINFSINDNDQNQQEVETETERETETEEENIPISSFEVEEFDHQNTTKKSFESRKKYYLSGKPLIGLYDRVKNETTKQSSNKNNLENEKKWSRLQPKHNDIFNQNDVDSHNIDHHDEISNQRKKKGIKNSFQNNNNNNNEGEVIETLLDKHFSHSTAVRHFNESMPVLVLPTGFSPEAGKLIASNPNDRIKSVRTKKLNSESSSNGSSNKNSGNYNNINSNYSSLNDAITNEEYNV